MQRIIKFRAWDTAHKKMFSPYEMGQDELQLNPDGRGFFNASSLSPKLSQYYPHMIPLQYTGLKDKNGAEIYEGDRLSVTRSPEHMKRLIADAPNPMVYVCEWVNMGFVLKSLYPYPFNESKFFYHIESDCEVIGNIWENPELLEAKEYDK